MSFKIPASELSGHYTPEEVERIQRHEDKCIALIAPIEPSILEYVNYCEKDAEDLLERLQDTIYQYAQYDPKTDRVLMVNKRNGI